MPSSAHNAAHPSPPPSASLPISSLTPSTADCTLSNTSFNALAPAPAPAPGPLSTLLDAPLVPDPFTTTALFLLPFALAVLALLEEAEPSALFLLDDLARAAARRSRTSIKSET